MSGDSEDDYLSEMTVPTRKFLEEEKLALFLDIDNTILHAIITYDIPYALFTHSATKDMFVFQMEAPKVEPHNTTSKVHSHHVHPHHALSPIQSEPSPHHLPSKLLSKSPNYELPTKLDHSNDSIRRTGSPRPPTIAVDADKAGPDSSSSSSDDSDPPFHIPSPNSRSGSMEMHSDSSASSDATSVHVRLNNHRLPSTSREPSVQKRRSETPDITPLETVDEDELASKPLYCLVKPRPGAISFLRSARHFFKIYICTFGSLEYATEIRNRFNAMVAKGDKEHQPPAIEPQIIAREAHRRLLKDMDSPEGDHSLVDNSSILNLAQTMRKNLKTILKSLQLNLDERMCVCLDDRLDVWTSEDAEKSVLKIHPYSFFFSHPIYELQAAEHGLHRLAAAPPPKLNLDLSSLNDDALRAAWMTLSTIHRKFFYRLNSHRLLSPKPSTPSPESTAGHDSLAPPDPLHGNTNAPVAAQQSVSAPVSSVSPNSSSGRAPPKFEHLPIDFLPSTYAYIAAYRLTVLKGVVITHQGRLVRDILLLASYFGADVLNEFTPTATHFLVSSTDPDTCKKVRNDMKRDEARFKHVTVVTCSWITDCARDGRKVSEQPYLLSNRFN